jgi:hypothetical protein
MPEKYYQDKLYPFQDEVLAIIDSAEVDFYLTGGTALSRCYLMHRYSDDLDLFVNAHSEFKTQTSKIVSLLNHAQWRCTVSTTSDTFARVLLESADDPALSLKIDFVDDVPSHYGDVIGSRIYSRVDSWRNILSNKLCALSRLEAKDIVDILFIAKRYLFTWEDIIGEAREKDLWVDPISICKIIGTFRPELLETIIWIEPVDYSELADLIQSLHDDIFYGRENSLVS